MVEAMGLWELYQQAARELSARMPEREASFEAFCLLEKLFGWNKNQVLLHKDQEVSPEQAENLAALLEKRKSGYPLQYLLGSWDFWGYDFQVGEGVLIPRADTETLCEAVLTAAKDFPAPVICDLCSGSGCLPVVYAKELPQARRIYAVELSEAALPYLRANVERHGCENVRIVPDDVLRWTPPEPLHIISANPPYLSADEMAQLQKEVSFEPKMALEAPENGLYFYRILSRRCYDWLAEGGFLAFEVGYRQAAAVAELMKKAAYTDIRITADLCGVERVVSGRKKAAAPLSPATV